MTSTDPRAAYIEGLRQLAQVLEDHPGVPLPYNSEHGPMVIGFHGENSRDRLGAAARAFPCTWAKDPSGEWFNLTAQLGGGLYLQLYAARDLVCTRRVVGTEEREVEEVVKPAVTRTVVKQVEVVTWDCGSLLAPAASPS